MKHLLTSTIIEVITDICLIGLSADLLYLYFAGAWSDPNVLILTIELIILPLILFFGIWRVWMFFRLFFEPEKEETQ